MRTLKKALSLVLVLAMVFALAVHGFAANTTKKASDFKDYSKVTNKEAVDVLTAVGVINGNADGTFNPEGSFTRAEAATMITYLTLGKTVADALPTSATKFSDVPATHWAAKYVQYCADAKIVNGVGNGKFDPDAKLTATQWSLMLLGALGYNAKNEGIGGEGWEIATTKLAMKAGVASAEDLTATFNRDMAAKLALNALKADVVEYATNGTNITIGDTTINTGASKAESQKALEDNGTERSYTATGDKKLQFCEQHFSGLKLTDTKAKDAMGRPAVEWQYNKKVVSTGVKTAAYTFVATKNYDVTDADSNSAALNKALNITATSSKLKYVGGDKTTVNGTDSNAWADNSLKAGDTVEVFVNSADATDVTNVVVTRYTVDTITAVKNLTTAQIKANESNADADVVAATQNITLKNGGTVLNTKFAGFDYKVGDTVLVAKKGSAVLASKATETVSGVVTSVNTTANTATVAGTSYALADGVSLTAQKGTQSFVVADGFIWGAAAQTASKEYVHILAVSATAYDNAFNEDGYVNVRYIDKAGTVTVAKAKVANTPDKNVDKNADGTKDEYGFYTVAADNDHEGFVKFTSVTTAYQTTNTLDKATAQVASGITANANTVFVLKTVATPATYKVVTGIANVPGYTLSSAAVYAVVNNSFADVVYIDVTGGTAAETKAKDVIYVLSGSPVATGYDAEKDVTYNEYSAIVNGEKTTIKTGSSVTTLTAGLVEVTAYDAKGFVKTVRECTADPYVKVNATRTAATVTYGASTLVVDSTSYVLADGATIYTIDSNDTVVSAGAADLIGTATGTFYIVYKSTTDHTVTAVYFDGAIA